MATPSTSTGMEISILKSRPSISNVIKVNNNWDNETFIWKSFKFPRISFSFLWKWTRMLLFYQSKRLNDPMFPLSIFQLLCSPPEESSTTKQRNPARQQESIKFQKVYPSLRGLSWVLPVDSFSSDSLSLFIDSRLDLHSRIKLIRTAIKMQPLNINFKNYSPEILF